MMRKKQQIFSIFYKILEKANRVYTIYCGYLVDKLRADRISICGIRVKKITGSNPKRGLSLFVIPA